ncbi:MAG: pyridoxal-phosphate dependent enzyme [Agarilytica sp.]
MLPSHWWEKDLATIAALAPLQEIFLEPLQAFDVRVFIKRDDLLDPYIGGNKIYKLHGHLRHHIKTQKSQHKELPILSFGGAYSNHLYALAAVGKAMGIQTIGIVRGERPQQLSATLHDVEKMGMQLHFVTRSLYREKNSRDFKCALARDFGEHTYVPEGGGGVLGAQGCTAMAGAIMGKLNEQNVHGPSAVVHACGTGTSLAGLAYGFETLGQVGSVATQCIGIPVLKNLEGLQKDVAETLTLLGSTAACWRLQDGYHFGGYAKFPADLRDFLVQFEAEMSADKDGCGEEGLLLDPVYTSKTMFAVMDLVQRRSFAPGSNVVVVHSGGLQGRRGQGLSFMAH